MGTETHTPNTGPVSRTELVRDGVLDPYSRRQGGVSIRDLYPDREDGSCSCGCGKPLVGRRTRYATEECSRRCGRRLRVILGHSSTIRWALYRREGGNPYGGDQARCQACGTHHPYWGDWEAHHVIPVSEGGGGCEIDGFLLLCQECHLEVHNGGGDG